MAADLYIIGDLHLLEKNPVARKDDLTETQWRKLREVFEAAWDNADDKPTAICLPGDIFDRPRSWHLLRDMIKFLKHYELPVLAVFGQHDTYMNSHKLRPLTNLGILSMLGLVHILGSKPLRLLNCNFYGASWGEDIPEVEDEFDSNIKNILLTHRSIAEAPLYPGQKYLDAKDFLKDNKNYDFIICGDIHREFYIEDDGRFILNPGPLLRKEATKYNFSHKPCYYICPTGSGEVLRRNVASERGLRVLSRKHMISEKQILTEHFDIEENGEEELTFRQELLLVMDEFEDEFDFEAVVEILGEAMEKSNV